MALYTYESCIATVAPFTLVCIHRDIDDSSVQLHGVFLREPHNHYNSGKQDSYPISAAGKSVSAPSD